MPHTFYLLKYGLSKGIVTELLCSICKKYKITMSVKLQKFFFTTCINYCILLKYHKQMLKI